MALSTATAFSMVRAALPVINNVDEGTRTVTAAGGWASYVFDEDARKWHIVHGLVKNPSSTEALYRRICEVTACVPDSPLQHGPMGDFIAAPERVAALLTDHLQ